MAKMKRYLMRYLGIDDDLFPLADELLMK